MKKNPHQKSDKFATSRGVTIIELVIVLVLIALLAAAAAPQLVGSWRLVRFTNMQQNIAVGLRDARQLAISERRRITFQYDDNLKQIRTYDDPNTPMMVPALGPFGDPRNRVMTFTSYWLSASDIVYGAPSTVSLADMTLKDTAPFTCPSTAPAFPAFPTPASKTCPGDIISITFNARGDVVIPTNGVTDFNKALFFYESNSETKFAVSILAPGGRVKIWRYNGNSNQYE